MINYSVSEVAADEPCLLESADMNVPFASRVTTAAEGLPRRRFTVAEMDGRRIGKIRVEPAEEELPASK